MAEDKKMCRWAKVVVKPLTVENIAFHYGPMYGIANYAALSVNVMNPWLISQVVPSRDVTNILLVNSAFGSALYIYNRPHLRMASTQMRLVYSGFGSVMFNFGSILTWAVLRTVTRSNCIATIIGLLTGFGLTATGLKCLQYVDSACVTSTSK